MHFVRFSLWPSLTNCSYQLGYGCGDSLALINMKSEVIFHFSGQDSLSQFWVWMLILGGGCVPLPLMVWQFGNLKVACASVSIALLVLLGLRASIDVSQSGVVITKRWFFFPYRRYRGKVIEQVYFDGDWGEPEGASGVVVKLSGKEIHIGSRRSMHQLHEALFPLQFEQGGLAQA